MALLGTGVLAIWNGIAGGADREFLEWHVRQHMPERLAVPGFNRGRRYAALSGSPAYFNFYEVEAPETLYSQAYLDRLNDPTDWTRSVVSTFADTSRTACRVDRSMGCGEGAAILTLCFDLPFALQAWSDTGLDVEKAVLSAFGVTGLHGLQRHDRPAAATAESTLRAAPDGSWPAIVLIEAAKADALRDLQADLLSDRALTAAGLPVPAARGLYALEFSLRSAV